MTAFCPNRIALKKRNGKIGFRNSYCLFSFGAKVHFHAARFAVKSCDMLESLQVEIAIELPIDAGEQIQIEGRRYPKRIIIGLDQLRNRFLQVGPQ